MKKTEVINSIIKNQKELFIKLHETINLYKTSSDLDEDNTLDPEDFSHQNEASEMQLHLEEKIKNEELILQKLEKFKKTINDTIEEGSLIETDLAYIYLGFAGNPISFEGKEVYCISLDAPIAQQLLHKTIGNTFNIGETTHTILNVY